MDFIGAKVQQRFGDNPGWNVEQPLRRPAKWNKWFGSSRWGDQAEAEAQRCKAEWDAEDSLAHLVGENCDVIKSSVPLYSLIKARKCDALEASALSSGDFPEGRAEWARRLNAGKFQQSGQSSMDGGEDGGVRDAGGGGSASSPQ